MWGVGVSFLQLFIINFLGDANDGISLSFGRYLHNEYDKLYYNTRFYIRRGNLLISQHLIYLQFDLTGTRSKLADFTSMAFLFGNALGSNPLSYFSDTRGRRAALILSLILSGIFGLLTTLSPDVYVFMILRMCQGMLFAGYLSFYRCVSKIFTIGSFL
jgi:MFS family permease